MTANANPSVLQAVNARTVEEHTATMLERMREVAREMVHEFSVPMLEVDTTVDYDPTIEAILTFATTHRS